MLPRPLQTLLVLPHLMMIMPAAATYVTDANISTAVAAWRADPAAAEASASRAPSTVGAVCTLPPPRGAQKRRETPRFGHAAPVLPLAALYF